MKKIAFITIGLLYSISIWSQVNPFCNNDDCGGLDPSWQLVGDETVACEGETFFLRSGESTPYNNIDSYTWILTNTATGEEVVNTTYVDTTQLEFNFAISDSIACANDGEDGIQFEVRLVVTSPTCNNGEDESCRYTAEPLTIKFRARARFQTDNIICVGDEITLINNSCNADDELYMWDFGDGQTSTEVNPNITFSTPGVYTISLKADNDCENPDQTTQTITVVDYPTANIVAETNDGQGCNPSRQIISIDANEWVLAQPSGYFEWSISGNNGDWCFTNDAQQSNPCPQDPTVNFCPCIPDSLLSPQIIDSLLQLPTLDIWFQQSGEYTVELDYGNVCEDITIEETLTIYEPPTIDNFNNLNACDELTICYVDLPITFTGDIASYNWTFTGGSIQNFSGVDPDFGCVTFTDVGSISLTIEAFDPCDDVTESIEVSIIETGVVTVNDPTPNIICQNDEPIFLNPDPDGGSYFLNAVEVTFISGDTLYPVLAQDGDYTIDYILNADCDAQDQFSFTILESPMIVLGDNPPACESISDFNPTIEMIGGDIDGYIWNLCDTMNTVILTSTDPDPSFDYDMAGNYIIKIELVSNECGSVFDSSAVIIQANDPAIIDPFDNPYCPGVDPVTLTATPSGGTWSGEGIVDSDSGLFDPSLLTTSTTLITYTINGEVCGSFDDQIIEVILNDLSLPAPISICHYDGEYTLGTTSPIGGTWSGDGLIDSNNGIIDLTGFTTDSTYTYTYCVDSDQIDCESCKNTTLYIEPTPTAGFSLMGSPCSGNEFMLVNESVNANNYMWDMGDGNMYNTAEPKHTYTAEGDYEILLIAKTDFGCEDQFSLTIHVTAPPIIDATVFTVEGCAPLTVDYTNNSSGENITQFWIIGGMDTLFGATPNIILDGVNSDSIITVELVVQNDCETVRSSSDVLVHPTPIANFGIMNDEGCSPDTVNFMNVTSGLPDTFIWDFGNGTTSTEFDPDPIVFTSPEDSVSMYTITLIAENMCGIDTFSKDIVVYPNNIDAFFEIDTLSGCPPLAVHITNYATPGATVTYDFGDGGTGNIPDTTYIFAEPGEYIITQYAAQCGIDSTKSDTITVFPLADVKFEMPSFACIGDTVTFNNMSTAGTVALWNFGDGNTSVDINATHIYTQSGDFDVELIVYSDFYNCPDSFTKTIAIPDLPEALFDTNPLESCPGETVTFTSTSQGDLNYEWDFGDGSGGNQTIETHMYVEAGIYEVKLTVYDPFGCSTDSTFINMNVHPDPTAAMSLSIDEICQFYDTIQVLDQSTGSISNQWYIDDNIFDSVASTINVFADMPGETTIKLVVANAFGCMDSISNNINILESPIAITSMIDTVGCQPFDISIEDISENSNLTTWMFDGSNSSSNILANHTYLNAGIYPNVLIAGNTNGCPNDTVIFDIQVFPKSIAAFDIVAFDSCGIPATIITDNQSTLSTTYTWDFGNGTSSTLFEPTIEYNMADDYLITLLTNNEFGCTDTTTQFIELYPQPVANLSLPDFDYCEGDTIVFNNASTNSTHFTYLVNGEDNTLDFPISLVEVGEYDLTIIANYEDVCTDTFSLQQTITIHDSPTAGFRYIADPDMDIKGGVDFFLMSVKYDDWLWDFGDGNISTEENPFHEYDGDGPQTVCLTAYNYNDGAKTCDDKIVDLIRYKDARSFYVPNAMSPDQDFGEFEVGVFKPKGVGIDRYELNIYSPWGDHIITLNEIVDGEPRDHWDGTYKGNPVPMGAYVWEAIVWFSETDKMPYRGTVTVIR